jgi:uncharacterized membrane protein YhaH (DUF805 family)
VASHRQALNRNEGPPQRREFFRMDWNWYLFSFEGRINRSKIWFAAFIWFATVFSFMTIFLFGVAGILRASGHDFHIVSMKTMHPALFLPGLPLLVIGVWLLAATAIKRLHDRNKSGWWLVPFFIAPGPLDKLSDWPDNPILTLPISALSFGLGVWCFVELFCLRGTKGANRFGPDPLAPADPIDTRPDWDQHAELEFVPHKAGPSAGAHVMRGHD